MSGDAVVMACGLEGDLGSFSRMREKAGDEGLRRLGRHPHPSPTQEPE